MASVHGDYTPRLGDRVRYVDDERTLDAMMLPVPGALAELPLPE